MSIESVMPSSHLILCRPLLLLTPIPPTIRVFSNESTLCMRWPKYWCFSLSISPSNEHPGLISFRMDWLDLLVVQGTLKSLLQHHSSKASIWGRSQDGGGIGWGDHFLSYKFIERTIERWANFTKQLLIASRGHQAPRKATHCLWREVGQNIKDKKGDKRARDRDKSREVSLNRGSFQSPGNPCTGGSEGSFQILEGNLTGKKN